MSDSMYLTGNEVPSADPRDRWDNGITLDAFVSGSLEIITTRTGKGIYTIAYLRRLFADGKSKIDAAVTGVNAAATTAKNDISAIVDQVQVSAESAQEDISNIVKGLGDDINTIQRSSLDSLQLVSPKYDGTVGIVTGDQDPAKDGYYSFNLASKTWVRLQQQPAWARAVSAEFYRTSNQISGNGATVIASDHSGRVDAIQAGAKKASVTVAGTEEVMSVNTLDKNIEASYPIKRKADILAVSVACENSKDSSQVKVLPDSEQALVLLLETGEVALRIDGVNKEITSNLSFRSGLEVRPPTVFVNEGPRLERNTSDPLYRLSDRVYQATATIARTGKSRYWQAWRADNTHAEEGPGNFTVLAYSDDNNKTVKEYGYFTYSPSHPDMHIVDPMLWLDPEDKLWLFFGVFGKNSRMDGVGGCWAVICQNPNAEFPVWGQPFRLSYFGDPRHPVMVNGEWYIAVDGWRALAEYPPRYMEHVGPHIYKLDWRNKSMSKVCQLPPNNNGQYSGFFETEFVQIADGRVMATNRWTAGDSGVLVSFSSNLKDWTPWINYLALAPASSSRIWLGRTPSGRLIMVWNNDTVRRTLTVGLSDDEGVTYPYRVVLEPNSAGQLTYPVVDYGDNGEIFVIYDNERITKKQIHIAKLIESEVVAGTSVPSITIVSDPANP